MFRKLTETKSEYNSIEWELNRISLNPAFKIQGAHRKSLFLAEFFRRMRRRSTSDDDNFIEFVFESILQSGT
jgi:predicted ATP-dependent Lon-type protease